MKALPLRIAEILSIRGFTAKVKLSDGTERALHLRRHMLGPMFEELLSNSAKFKAMRIEAGTLSWPTGQDLCPDVLLDTEVAQRGKSIDCKVAARWLEAMAVICQFDGITVYMYPKDHPPPHIHVKYAARTALVTIADGKVLEGDLPKNVQRKVRYWIELRQGELREAYFEAQQGKQPGPIPPP